VYLARLHKKIEADPQTRRLLVTEPGVGYRLVTDPRPGVLISDCSRWRVVKQAIEKPLSDWSAGLSPF
jgi:hypothetical protein